MTTYRRGVALALLVLGCQSPTGDGVPWRLEPAAEVAAGPRILVLHDMEGLSGQDDPDSFRFGKPEYALGQELLAADVNAVIAGLFDGGAAEVHVVDGHGSGNPDPDIRSDLLDPRATQVFRQESFDTYFDLVAPGVYDGVAVVGMHAKTGSGGFASHTFTLGIEFRLNGQAITETELVALSWGRVGVPVVFASGDDVLQADLRTMPWIEYVAVKQATSASTVVLRPVEEARAELTAAATRAVQNLSSARVMVIDPPMQATLKAVPPASLAVLRGVPGLAYDENSVTFTAGDLREAYDGLVSLVGVARVGYDGLLRERLRGRPDGAAILTGYSDALFERWLDHESGRWRPSASSSPPTTGRYHGYR